MREVADAVMLAAGGLLLAGVALAIYVGSPVVAGLLALTAIGLWAGSRRLERK